MKQRLLITIFLLGFAVSAAQAGLFKDSVDLVDLSEVPAESLETLRDTEFAVFLAEVNLNAAKATERRAAEGVKTASRELDAENLDMKAAKAEQKAAKAKGDEPRMTAAGAMMSGASEDVATAKALRKWKAQEHEARRAEVAMAKSALDLAEARRDVARVRLLKQENAPSADKYDLGELERNVAKRQKELDSAGRKARDKAAEIEGLKLDWERRAERTDPTGSE